MPSLQVPKRPKRPRQQEQQQRKPILTILTIVATLSWASVLFVTTRSFLIRSNHQEKKQKKNLLENQAKHDKVAENVMLQGLPQDRQDVETIDLMPDNYQHEGFFNTLKSCLPQEKTKKCKTFIPENNEKRERIALLRPPGSLGFLLDHLVEQVVKIHLSKEQQEKIQLIPTSHVPPYGYGKTHGYTRIIRLVSLPISLAAADMVLDSITSPPSSSKNQAPISMESITIQDLTQAMRQLIRWNCRLSAVAAHTSMLTLTLEDLLEDVWKQEFIVLQFLQKTDISSLDEFILNPNHVDEDQLQGSVDVMVDRATRLWHRIQHVGSFHAKQMDDRIKSIIDSELNQTNNLKDWPCLSFWAVGGNEDENNRERQKDMKDNDKISQLSRLDAQQLSPNCHNDEFANCWVPRDVCEANGDAKCRQQQQKGRRVKSKK